MRYAFIINPAAGNGKGARRILKEIKACCERDTRAIRYYLTEGECDASVLADSLAKEAAEAGDEIRVYACGGDGTVHEVANGLYGHPHAALGVVPVGSGNDFFRNFGDRDFLDVEGQLDAEAKAVDVLAYSCVEENRCIKRVCINGLNIGFDGNTAILAHRLKEMPLVSGSMSYLLSIAINFVEKRGQNLRVTVDGKRMHKGALLMCTVSNGRFCGGGIESCPNAIVDNGLAEVLVVKDIGRKAFLKAFPRFKKGKLFSLSNVDELVTYAQGKQVLIEPRAKRMKFVVDGEILETGALSIEVEPLAMKVLVPKAK